MNKTVLVIIAGVLSAIVIVIFIFNSSFFVKTNSLISNQNKSIVQNEAITDYFASFAIYTNGTFRIFTDSRYHNLSEDGVIDSSNPNTVHVKKSNITWGDFFKTLPMELTESCLTTGTGQVFCNTNTYSLKFYINGIRTTEALNKVINKNDQLLVSYGDEDDNEIQNQLQQLKVKKQ